GVWDLGFGILHSAALLLSLIGALCAATQTSPAQSPLPIYTDRLVNGFQDWSWAPRNLSATAPVHSGANAISVSAADWQAMSFHESDFNTSIYSNFTFWAHGGVSGGQLLQVNVDLSGVGPPAYSIPRSMSSNAWHPSATT